jgi:hypothetical protein
LCRRVLEDPGACPLLNFATCRHVIFCSWKLPLQVYCGRSEHNCGQVSTGEMGTNFLTFSLLNDFWLFITLISSSSNYDHNPNANPWIKSIQSNVIFPCHCGAARRNIKIKICAVAQFGPACNGVHSRPPITYVFYVCLIHTPRLP